MAKSSIEVMRKVPVLLVFQHNMTVAEINPAGISICPVI